uniref:Uncharacterized protein n=1 Tax=Candidatus Methanophaga sp. ANME-1 ERB7 TaxID=2759913 RepID=A0A7G9ZBF2_9EURY|nr:hypothetical protein GIFCIIHN_00002 [Methanosarcinales archaeon ANME-1 ERB7]
MKKKMKVGLVVVVAIAAVMMFSSYAGALSQDEIAGLMLNASEVDTYKFDMNMTMTSDDRYKWATRLMQLNQW